MIETLLKEDLPQAYGLTRPHVTLSCDSKTGIFELGDQVACRKCKSRWPDRNECNERVMKIDATDNTITIVDYEEYMNQFNGKQYANGGRCDLMMFDDADKHKVVFCDLGCYSEEHVEKKRIKSYQQVCDSLTRFLRKPCGKSFIDQFGEKVLIFGRRDPAVKLDETPEPKRGDAKGNMQAFLTNPVSKSKYAVSAEVVEGENVDFVIVNYPEPYVW